jgi:alkanesulfonate monooxygenase SsuD/methylene tetrahydromethanopterin reductase-like flavin-dependent oxidoreductase (luciferase family)
MKFAMFYEIPVAKPWGPRSEYEAYQNTIEQAKLGDRMGFHSFWTVEHHFLDEYSHCSNPEVLYGHLAAVTRTCASATACGCCRSRTTIRCAPPRASPRSTSVGRARRVRNRPLVDPRRDRGLRHRPARDARDVGRGARPHRRLLDERRVRVLGQALADAAAARAPQAVPDPHPPIWGATSSVEATTRSGQRGIGLLSFTVGNPPSRLEERIQNYRRGRPTATNPSASSQQHGATFTMVHCNDTNEKARAVAEESFVWYPKTAALSIASLAEWMAEGSRSSATTATRVRRSRASSRHVRPLEHGLHLRQRAGVVGDPDRCIEICKRYEAVGCELLFCLLNPYKIPHEEVMHSIELLGKHVIPEFAE